MEEYKEIIKENLNNILKNGFIPELGEHRSGKVREIHFAGDEKIIMVASDRVSCFDHILSRQIPFKGHVLNSFAKWAFENTKDIIGNAVLKSPHENVIIQKKMNKIAFEFVVRGYVWGSMAADYEDGEREFCGIKLPDGLLRYQKLDSPLFTPATKEEGGDHDINVSFEYMADKLGMELATKLRDAAIALYNRGAKLAEEKGFIFVDTKYEFGLDENNVPFLIDEANTPDSSRFCSVAEYGKFEEIKKEAGSYKDVTSLLVAKPALKIEELSKQFVRDILVEKGFSYGASGEPPMLADEDIVEASFRYIDLYEKLTGNKFEFPSGSVKVGVIESLKKEGYIKGGIVVIMAVSDSDIEHINKIKEELDKYGVGSIVRICSAHKQGGKCESIVKKYNTSIEPVVIVAVAGGTDALSGVASFHSVHPVVSCPPGAEFDSCLHNPPGSSNSVVLNVSNLARHCAQILSESNDEIKEKILSMNEEKISKLEKADI